MPRFLTEIVDEDGNKWAGPEIEAGTWAQAYEIASKTGHQITGILAIEADGTKCESCGQASSFRVLARNDPENPPRGWTAIICDACGGNFGHPVLGENGE